MLIFPVLLAAAFSSFGDKTKISITVSSGARGKRTSTLKIQLKINGFVGCLILISATKSAISKVSWPKLSVVRLYVVFGINIDNIMRYNLISVPL